MTEAGRGPGQPRAHGEPSPGLRRPSYRAMASKMACLHSVLRSEPTMPGPILFIM